MPANIGHCTGPQKKGNHSLLKYKRLSIEEQKYLNDNDDKLLGNLDLYRPQIKYPFDLCISTHVDAKMKYVIFRFNKKEIISVAYIGSGLSILLMLMFIINSYIGYSIKKDAVQPDKTKNYYKITDQD